MESIRNIIAQAEHWLKKESSTITPAASAPSPLKVSDEQRAARAREAEAATAGITNAFETRATAFAVRYHDETFVITSAHHTNNRQDISKGFTYDGKKYFLLIKGAAVAFAEHIALNPQGSVCSPRNEMDVKKPFRDISILRPTSPEKTREMLYRYSFKKEDNALLKNIFSRYPSLGNPLEDDRFSADELARLTNEFKLAPIAMSDHPPTEPHGQAYSIAYFKNRPEHVPSDYRAEPSNGSILLNFSREKPIISGHSGSLLYTLSANGSLAPLGVITASDSCDYAHATPFKAVREGLHAIVAHQVITSATLDHFCMTTPGQSVWLQPSGISPSVTPRFAPAESAPLNRKVAPCPTR